MFNLGKVGSGIGSLVTGASALISSGIAAAGYSEYQRFCASYVGGFKASTVAALAMQAMNDHADIFGEKPMDGFNGLTAVKELCGFYSNTTKVAVALAVTLAVSSVFLMRRACSRT